MSHHIVLLLWQDTGGLRGMDMRTKFCSRPQLFERAPGSSRSRAFAGLRLHCWNLFSAHAWLSFPAYTRQHREGAAALSHCSDKLLFRPGAQGSEARLQVLTAQKAGAWGEALNHSSRAVGPGQFYRGATQGLFLGVRSGTLARLPSHRTLQSPCWELWALLRGLWGKNTCVWSS